MLAKINAFTFSNVIKLLSLKSKACHEFNIHYLNFNGFTEVQTSNLSTTSIINIKKQVKNDQFT